MPVKPIIRLCCLLLLIIFWPCFAYADLKKDYAYAPQLIQTVFDYCENPQEYLDFHHGVWGDLTYAEGDIVWFTLSGEQRELIHFPELNEEEEYYTENGTCYHSAPFCYTLLRSDVTPISLCDAIALGLLPCSKCVNDDYYNVP